MVEDIERLIGELPESLSDKQNNQLDNLMINDVNKYKFISKLANDSFGDEGFLYDYHITNEEISTDAYNLKRRMMWAFARKEKYF